MPRPKKNDWFTNHHFTLLFKQIGMGVNALERISLNLDELEAIRLTDYVCKEHSEAADEMEISHSTFTRLIKKAQGKVARFLIEGKNLFIEGGDVHFRGNVLRCQHCGHMFKSGFDKPIQTCPACGSTNLIDLAGGFGHGNCCHGHNQNPRG